MLVHADDALPFESSDCFASVPFITWLLENLENDAATSLVTDRNQRALSLQAPLYVHGPRTYSIGESLVYSRRQALMEWR